MNSETRVIKDLYLKMFYVTAASVVTAYVGAIVDSLTISRLMGVSFMPSFQLVAPLSLIVIALSMFINFGFSNCYCRYLGAGKIKEAHQVFTASVTFLLVVSLILSLCFYFFADGISVGFGAEPGSFLQVNAAEYIRGLAFGFIVIPVSQVLSTALSIDGKRTVVLFAVVIQTAVNCIGDMLAALVFKNGLFGMGLATTACNIVSIAVILLYILIKKPSFKLDYKGLRFSALLPVFIAGFPSALERLYLTIQTMVINSYLLSHGSEDHVAAFAIITTVFNLISCVGVGSAQAMFSFSSVLRGEKDKKSLAILLKVATTNIIKKEAVLIVLIMIFSPLICLFFIGTGSENVLNIATFGLRFYVIYAAFNALNLTYSKYVIAMGSRFLSYFFSFAEYILLFIPCLFIFGGMFGVDLCFLGFIVSEVLTIVVLIIIATIKNKRPVKGIEDIMFLPKEFDGTDTNVYASYADDIDSMIKESRKVYEFCIENGGDKRTAMLLSLACEEMIKNLLSHNKGKTHLSSDIRLVHGDKWLLRMRDNGAPFNPKKWQEIYDTDNKHSNFGIRLVSNLSDNFTYMNTLGSNTLIIEL